MAWTFLLLAGVCEIGWPVGLKLGWTAAGIRYPWIAFAALCMIASGALLFLAQRTIPMGTAYAVWTGIGAVGAFAIGILFFGDAATAVRIGSATLILAGVVGLKIG
ncbi:MAG: multidrug efflux SMR transporter [Deltaproteobacteria bacterium]